MEYVVKSGDTLQSIAQRVLGNAELWPDIAEMNGLVYPYISNSSSVGIVSPGDILWLKSNRGDSTIDEVSFGADLKLSTDKSILSYNVGGDLVVNAEGDYSLAEDLECLLQDTSHRLMTTFGSLPYHPSYGSRISGMIGSKKDDGWETRINIEISRTIKCDDRIKNIRDIHVSSLPTGVFVDYTLETDRVTFRAREVLDNEEI